MVRSWTALLFAFIISVLPFLAPLIFYFQVYKINNLLLRYQVLMAVSMNMTVF